MVNLPDVLYKVAFPEVILFCAAFQKVEIQEIENKVSSFSAIFLEIISTKYTITEWISET